MYIFFHTYTYRYTCIDDLPTVTGSRQAPMCKRLYTYNIYNIRITSQLGFSTAMDCSIILLAVGIAAAAMAAMDQNRSELQMSPMCSNSKMLELCPKHMDEMQWLIVLPQILLCILMHCSVSCNILKISLKSGRWTVVVGLSLEKSIDSTWKNWSKCFIMVPWFHACGCPTFLAQISLHAGDSIFCAGRQNILCCCMSLRLHTSAPISEMYENASGCKLCKNKNCQDELQKSSFWPFYVAFWAHLYCFIR